MGNIFTSSIGKKLIMSISGLFLMIFLVVHLIANGTSLISPEAFEAACEFMSMPLIKIMVPVLAAGFVVHIIYASYLTITNLKARGNERYAVSHTGKSDSWAAKNMFVLGIIVLGFLAFHLTHFWAKMQLPEFLGQEAEDPNMLMEQIFGSLYFTIAYIVWFIALWFHLSHGFWSAFQTLGANNSIWIKRWQVVAQVYATVVVAGFIIIALNAYLKANGII